jgi:trehalose 2-sulfotransferase
MHLTTYIIASVQRSGTHLLCSLLRSTGVAGWPDEHFLSKPSETWEERWVSPSRMAYVERVLRENTTSNGVFGTVVMWSYFDRMLQLLQEIPAYKNFQGAELLAEVLHRPRYIWLRRRNRVEQAVSWAIACQTGVWAQKPREKPHPRVVPKFDFEVIDEWLNRIEAHETGWARYFRENHIDPFVLFYEDVVACNRSSIEHVLEFLGMPTAAAMGIAPSTFEKQANQISQQWTAAYLKQKGERQSYRANNRDC